MTMTVDGFIAKADGSLWDAFPWSPGMLDHITEFFRGVGTAVYSRPTYEAIVPFWHSVAIGQPPPGTEVTDRDRELAQLLEDIEKVVFSRSMETGASDASILNGDVAETVRELKGKAGPDLVLHAGGSLVSELAEARLIDEYMLYVSPAAIGSGKQLFSEVNDELPLRLEETRVFDSAFTLLRYAST
jgi:dihydrofolate reductase